MISQREFRNDSGKIMRGLSEGESYIVTRHSEPVGELRPLRRQRIVDSVAVLEMFEAAPVVDRERFVADLDVVADQTMDPRA